MKVLMCVPNISEGCKTDLIEQVASAVKSTSNIRMLECTSDKAHNRSVFTYIGKPESVLEATKKLADISLSNIDMAVHKGDHPRMGAVDVVPFIPVREMTTAEAIAIARQFGKFLGDKGVPVYYYEDAASSPERRNLVQVRKGQYEALAGKLKDPAWLPDEGAACFNKKSGATAVGVRPPLIALNVNLATGDLNIASTIARKVRHMNGGFRFVRAIGVNKREQGMVQVSMNLTNYEQTPVHMVLEAIRSESSRYGILIHSTELVGPVPIKALEEVTRFYLQAHEFSSAQIIENNLMGLDSCSDGGNTER